VGKQRSARTGERGGEFSGVGGARRQRGRKSLQDATHGAGAVLQQAYMVTLVNLSGKVRI